MNTETYTLPAYWASALINDDNSGMEDQDILDMQNWLETNKPGYCAEVSEEAFFGRFNGMGCDLLEYTFIKD